MSLTAWDGHVRVDYLPMRGRVHVTLLTAEPTVEADLRPGLRAAFVDDDPHGPPAFIALPVEAGGRLPTHVRDLLGERLFAIAEQVVDHAPRSRWTRLDLLALDDLAAVWAPYRHRMLATVADPGTRDAASGARGPVPGLSGIGLSGIGRWANGLWALLGVDDLRRGLAALPSADPVFMSGGVDNGSVDDADDFDDSLENPSIGGGAEDTAAVAAMGTWELPADIAVAAGVRPTLRWEVRRGMVDVVAEPAGTGPPRARLSVSFDDGSERWESLVMGPSGLLRATIWSATEPDRAPTVRIRTEELP
ncbi:hypothetical protein [Frankia sp. Cr2]|uniref:hypothetical protein n=1 Tax=Frankia sp. Cr2 TaxID=3073932 RepID=UPI002AD33936|nr:hypothetical protein [Frankia sp. Cr2]